MAAEATARRFGESALLGQVEGVVPERAGLARAAAIVHDPTGGERLRHEVAVDVLVVPPDRVDDVEHRPALEAAAAGRQAAAARSRAVVDARHLLGGDRDEDVLAREVLVDGLEQLVVEAIVVLADVAVEGDVIRNDQLAR